MKLNHKADIIMLQETHCDRKNENLWVNEYGNKMFFANGDSNARGVAIGINKKIANSVDKVQRDMDGRYLVINFTLEGMTYCLCNIYAPNCDNMTWYQELMNLIQNENCIYTVIGGDFNLVMDPKQDRQSARVHHPRARNVVLSSMEEMNLTDIWRAMNPDKKSLTWMADRANGSWSRIDFFLISNSLVTNCEEAYIAPSICTDHSLIALSVNVSHCKRGPGIWKFNTELLKDEKFCEEMSDLIQGIKRVYDYMDSKNLWEILKLEISNFARDYSKYCAHRDKEQRFNLYQTLEELQSELVKYPGFDPDILNNIRTVKTDLDAFETREAKRAAFRCRQQWARSGEISSKYYFNLEKRNQMSKTMYIAQKADGSLTKNYKEILNLQHQFFDQLYTSDAKVRFNLQNDTDVFLPRYMKDDFDKDVSEAELYDAMMTLKTGKTPGGDGIPLEFYRHFWKLLIQPLHAMYKQAMREKCLNPSGSRGVINLIPKKNKNLLLVKDWRGITLLGYDYKIWSKMIANRLEESTFLIGCEQNGFIKGRSIFTNVKKTLEVVSHLKKKNLPGILVQIDFEKCFDRIEFQSIKGTFEYFGFGSKFIEMIFLLFNNLQLRTCSNGYSSTFMKKGRGVNQGCCASPMIFSYCSTIMQHIIYANDRIHGININGIRNLLSQFADDTSAFLKYDRLEIEEFTHELYRVEMLMGLKVSYEKTTVYRLGRYNTVKQNCIQRSTSNGPMDRLTCLEYT